MEDKIKDYIFNMLTAEQKNIISKYLTVEPSQKENGAKDSIRVIIEITAGTEN